MPYYLCPACALRAYSAASESRCPSCDAPLRPDDQFHPYIPPAESLGTERARPRPVRRFLRDVSKASLQ